MYPDIARERSVSEGPLRVLQGPQEPGAEQLVLRQVRSADCRCRAQGRQTVAEVGVGYDWENDALLSQLVEYFGVFRVLYGLDDQTLLDLGGAV